MKYWLAAVIFFMMLRSTLLLGAEMYPRFERDYWVSEQDLAKGKMQRGVGLGMLGLVSLWPTSVLIARAADNPQKYFALSAVFGISTIGATLHGFGSVGFGKKQLDAATQFVRAYDSKDSTGVSSVDNEAEREEYLAATRKTSKKVLLFGAFLATQGAILLTNAIWQSVRKRGGEEMGDIKIWPYYLVGGLLLPGGVALIVKSKHKLNGLDTLATVPIPSTMVSFSPYFYRDGDRRSNFGVSVNGVF